MQNNLIYGNNGWAYKSLSEYLILTHRSLKQLTIFSRSAKTWHSLSNSSRLLFVIKCANASINIFIYVDLCVTICQRTYVGYGLYCFDWVCTERLVEYDLTLSSGKLWDVLYIFGAYF